MNAKSKHNLALILLSITAIVWGAGFLFANSLLNHGFHEIPLTLNAVRFFVGAVILLIIFAKRIKFSKNMLLWSSISGLMLCVGFSMQLVGLRYTTPAICGFYTAGYALFVPFMAWIFLKKRPSWLTFLGVFVAMSGLLILNLQSVSADAFQNKELIFGNILTLIGSFFFAAQMVFAEYVLHTKKADNISFTVLMVLFCTVGMILAAVIFDSSKYSTVQIDLSFAWWQLAIVGILGTAFAYFSQTFAQVHLSSTETSIVLACESPIGALLSVVLAIEPFTWQMCVGGILVLAAVVILEILPNVLNKKSAPPNSESIVDSSEQSPDNPTENQDTEKG